MSFRSTARSLLRAHSSSRMLRRLLRAQEATAVGIQEQNAILSSIGKVLATATGQQWSALTPARPPEAEEDLSGLSYVDDDLLGKVAAAQEDYQDRFGREISDTEALRVVADYEQAQRELDQQEPAAAREVVG